MTISKVLPPFFIDADSLCVAPPLCGCLSVVGFYGLLLHFSFFFPELTATKKKENV